MYRPDPPAIALIELDSIARALHTGDAMVKRAEIRVIQAGPISPGRYLILITGGEAEVEESWRRGKADAAEALIDSLYLPGVHGDTLDAIHGKSAAALRPDCESLGVFETRTVSAAIIACDAACKTTPVRILEMRLGQGIGGKGVFTLAADLADLEAALEAAEQAIADRRALLGKELIARPDPAFGGGLR